MKPRAPPLVVLRHRVELRQVEARAAGRLASGSRSGVQPAVGGGSTRPDREEVVDHAGELVERQRVGTVGERSARIRVHLEEEPVAADGDGRPRRAGR